MEDPAVTTILIFDLQMIDKSVNNYYKSEGFGMQDFEDDLSWVSAESVTIFAQSLGAFTQSSDLLA